MHGAAYANWAVNGEFEQRTNPNDPMVKIAPGADLLLAFGVRFDDRVTGKVEKFCETGTIVHIDIDPSEINKNKPANLPIVSDIKYALGRLGRDGQGTADPERNSPPGTSKLQRGRRKRRFVIE